LFAFLRKPATSWGVIPLIGVGLPLCFGCVMTLQVSIAVALLRREPRWRGWLSLLPPLAPLALYWALTEKMYTRVGLWGLSVALYVTLLALAYI
jgi:hypothetical protein